MAHHKTQLPNTAALVIEDDDGRPNMLRVVEHDGRWYFEMQSKHDGAVIYSLVRAPRLRVLPLLLGWLGL